MDRLPARLRGPQPPVLATAIQLATSGRLDEAAQALEEAAKRGDDPAEVYSALGHVRFEQHRWEDAAAAYAKVTSLDVKHPSARYNLGLCLERQGKLGEAATEFEAASGRNPKLWQAFTGRGLCLLHAGQNDQAVRCFDEALRSQPNNDRALFGKAVALHRLGRLDEAGELYRKLLPGNASSEELLSNLIALSVARKEESKVREFADRLLKIRPQSRPALETLAS